MINTKNKLIDLAVDYFLANKDKISYEQLDVLFNGNIYIDELTTAAMLLVSTAIVHNIPIKNELRQYENCYNGLITFWKSNKQEKYIVAITSSDTLIDLASGCVLPALEFLNKNHDFLVSGKGERIPDLIDTKTGITYEVKSNYMRRKSVSSLHNANRLLDCDNTHLVCYYVHNDIPESRAALMRFPNKIPEFKYSHAVSNELLSIIKAGELIPEVEKRLAELGFSWNP